MNRWACMHAKCGVVALGVGGAMGLRAIGWSVFSTASGPVTVCPAHHPQGHDEAQRQATIAQDVLRELVP